MEYLVNKDSSVNIVTLLLCIILKDFALIPSRDIQILKTLSKNSSSNSNREKLGIWLNTLTSFEYQDEQMYRSISPSDINRIYYLKKFLYNVCEFFVEKNEILSFLADCFNELSTKSKATPKIVSYFDFLVL
jgi:hypothetical protein